MQISKLQLAQVDKNAKGVLDVVMEVEGDQPIPSKFRLRWPTTVNWITQPYGTRPEYYSKFKCNQKPLTGHEGIDFAAPHGSGIYACADGVVSRVETNETSGNYGIQVKIEHEFDNELYQTTYAHLLKPAFNLKVKDRVTRGQLIGYADSTGNSTGSHLHLTFKHYGDTQTDQPCDICDPTPYLDPFGVP